MDYGEEWQALAFQDLARALQTFLRTTNLTVIDWFVIPLPSLVPVGLVEAFKYLKVRAGVPAG